MVMSSVGTLRVLSCGGQRSALSVTVLSAYHCSPSTKPVRSTCSDTVLNRMSLITSVK